MSKASKEETLENITKALHTYYNQLAEYGALPADMTPTQAVAKYMAQTNNGKVFMRRTQSDVFGYKNDLLTTERNTESTLNLIN